MEMDTNKAIRDVGLTLWALAMTFAACEMNVTREVGAVRQACIQAGHSVLECQQSTK